MLKYLFHSLTATFLLSAGLVGLFTEHAVADTVTLCLHSHSPSNELFIAYLSTYRASDGTKRGGASITRGWFNIKRGECHTYPRRLPNDQTVIGFYAEGRLNGEVAPWISPQVTFQTRTSNRPFFACVIAPRFELSTYRMPPCENLETGRLVGFNGIGYGSGYEVNFTMLDGFTPYSRAQEIWEYWKENGIFE